MLSSPGPHDPRKAPRQPDRPLEGAREHEIAQEPGRLRKALKLLGPGFVTGASDDDPTAVGTYAVAGAQFGYATAWTALFTYPMMATVQFLCAKIGLCAGQGLATVMRQRYPAIMVNIIVLALLVANVINVGADIGIIASAFNLLVPLPVTVLVVPVGATLLALQVWGSFKTVERIFKWLALFLLAYVGAVFLAHPHWPEVLRGTFVPAVHWDPKYMATMVAILGTNISPYLFFWQVTEEVEGRKCIGQRRLWQRRGASDLEFKYAAWDVNIGMFLSNVIVWSVNIACAATLFAAGQHEINTAADAAAALKPLAGQWATLLFAVGMIGSGFLSVPVLTASGAYALAETFGWKSGLDRTPGRAPQFYIIIAAATVLGVLFNYLGINAIAALFWSSVLNGLLAPPLLVLIMRMSNDPAVVGERKNGYLVNGLGWLTTISMFAAALGLFLTWGQG